MEKLCADNYGAEASILPVSHRDPQQEVNIYTRLHTIVARLQTREDLRGIYLPGETTELPKLSATAYASHQAVVATENYETLHTCHSESVSELSPQLGRSTA